MSIVTIELGYGSAYAEKIKAASDEDYARLRDIFPSLPEDRTKQPSLYGDQLISFPEDGPFLSRLGIEFTVKRFRGNLWVGPSSPPEVQPDGTTTLVQHVHIANPALFEVDEVTWMDDACTQELQSMLNDDWRILAVCPPACQRRPDYILGRIKGRRR